MFHNTNRTSGQIRWVLFLKGWIGNMTCTLATVYAPKTGQMPFSLDILNRLQNFQEGGLILEGDFNLVLDLTTDSTGPWSHLTASVLKKGKTITHEMQLVEIWYIQNPWDKGTTHFSHIYTAYSLIDILFVSHAGSQVFMAFLKTTSQLATLSLWTSPWLKRPGPAPTGAYMSNSYITQ